MSEYNPPNILEKQKELFELLYDCSEDFALLETVWHTRAYTDAMRKTIKLLSKTKEIQRELNRIYNENSTKSIIYKKYKYETKKS